ncbi:uncharacterized protein LOC125769159 [Anopheles funestus]|uniref:uncharacterized protein LOC125769159 n=1 Tax=Anopheles funestus TaxID=62324 RepID=UPI0020C6B3F2|nr:uncharacterized protein LOC125769159 [Anopheles funestus]
MRNMIPSRSMNRPNNIPHGRQPIDSLEASSSDTIVPGVPDTSSGMCNEYAPSYNTRGPGYNSWYVPASNEPNVNYPAASSTPLLPVETDDEDPVPIPSEHDPSEHVVMKDGYTFYIRYLDESVSEEPLVQRNHGADFCEVESLPSISNELSMLMDDSMLPEGAISMFEPNESSQRDWINYDELPLLNQQKRQQTVSTDHVSPQSDTLGENHRGKNNQNTLVKPTENQHANEAGLSGCEMFPVLTNTAQSAGAEFSQSNETVLMNSSVPTLVTMVPDFSHYCVECEKFFPSNDSLQEHMESNHRLFDETLITRTSTPKASFHNHALVWPCTTIVDSTNQRRKRPFFCDSCNISFDFVESYYMHNHSVHGGGVGTGYR